MHPNKKALRLLVCVSALSALIASAARAANPLDPVTVTIDTTKGSSTVADKFAGLMDAANSGKLAYDPSTPFGYQYKNLVNQMQVKHWRMTGGLTTVTGSTLDQETNFFNFLTQTGCPTTASVLWGLWLYNDPNPGVDNPATVLGLLQDPAKAPFIEAFAFGNEINYNVNIAKDRYVSGYTTNKANPPWDPSGLKPGAKYYWDQQRAWVHNTLSANGLSDPAYMGCDTGDGDPSSTDFQVTAYKDHATHPWMTAFAMDQVNPPSDPTFSIKAATQHLYAGDGTRIPTWDPANTYAPYMAGDIVADPADVDPNTGLKIYYKCILKYVSPANNTSSPKQDTTHWASLEPVFQSGTAYNPGDVVRDNNPNDGNVPGTLFQCVTALTAHDHPYLSVKNGFSYWIYAERKHYAFLSAHQLALHDMPPAVVSGWRTEVNTRLSSAPGWPNMTNGQPLPFRMTEFSPYAGPDDGGWMDTGVDLASYIPSNKLTPPTTRTDNLNGTFVRPGTQQHTDCFASALIGLEMFHFWARMGALGVNPIEGVYQMNSPIYSVNPGPNANGIYQPTNPFKAQPYAYVWPAFNISGKPGVGKELWQTAFTVNSNQNNDNFGIYAVTSTTTDVYVTIINKNFDYNDGLVDSLGNPLAAGKRDLAMTIQFAAGGFAPTKYRTMTLNTGGVSGDPTSAGVAKLGGQILDPERTTAFPETWSALTNWTGQAITVPSFTAMIVDFQK